ncbi:MAG: hypothetical protein JXA36_04370 [Coriobacteriia bacterium]|nr:hypothetical protein [Coriobacteriia bacterium]
MNRATALTIDVIVVVIGLADMIVTALLVPPSPTPRSQRGLHVPVDRSAHGNTRRWARSE